MKEVVESKNIYNKVLESVMHRAQFPMISKSIDVWFEKGFDWILYSVCCMEMSSSVNSGVGGTSDRRTVEQSYRWSFRRTPKSPRGRVLDFGIGLRTSLEVEFFLSSPSWVGKSHYTRKPLVCERLLGFYSIHDCDECMYTNILMSVHLASVPWNLPETQ
jgi:hypothetical protein